MTPAVQETRDRAVAALKAASWTVTAGDLVANEPTWARVANMIEGVADYMNEAHGPPTADRSLDLAALHSLALLLAALTAPPPTCAPGCVRFASEGAGHPGACSVPEVQP